MTLSSTRSSVEITAEKSASYETLCDQLFDIAEDGDFDEFTKCHNQLISFFPDRPLALLRDDYNNTVLHIATRCNTAEFVKALLNILGKDAPIACRIVSNSGWTPIQIADEEKSRVHRSQLLELIIPHSLNVNIKRLNEKLDAAVVLKQFPEAENNPRLAKNLKRGCGAVNYAREGATCSYTHPYFNRLTADEKFSVIKRLDQMREATFTMSCKHVNLCFLLRVAELIREDGAVNCGELALLAYLYLVLQCEKDQRLKTTNFNMVEIVNGDHVLILIDPAENFDLSNLSTLGDHAVFADAWSGEVFPVAYAPQKLKDCLTRMFEPNLNQYYSFLADFNPLYHKLAVYNEWGSPGLTHLKKRILTSADLAEFISALQNPQNIRDFLARYLGRDHLKSLLTNDSDIFHLLKILPRNERWKLKIIEEIYAESFIHLSIKANNISLFESLIEEAKLSPDAQANGKTVLHIAAAEKHTWIQRIIKAGANCTIRDASGKTPVDAALQNKDYRSVVYILLSLRHTFALDPQDYRRIQSLCKKLKSHFVVMLREFSEEERRLLVDSVLNAQNALGVLLHQRSREFLAVEASRSVESRYIKEIREKFAVSALERERNSGNMCVIL